MKKLATFLAVFSVFAFCAINTAACDAYGNGDAVYELTEDGNAYMVSGFTGNPVDLTIPAVYKEKPVMGVKENAFLNCLSLSKLTVLDECLYFELGKGAFKDCYGLAEVSLPSALVQIPDEAFAHCTALKSISLPNVVTVGKSAFEQCQLESVSLPKVATIGEKAFQYCSTLKTVNLPIGTQSGIPYPMYTVGAYAFSYCFNALESIDLQNARAIGEYAFERCSALKTLNFGTNLASVGEKAFDKCPVIETITGSEGTVSKVKNGCLLINSKLILAGSNGTVPDGTSIIGDYAFCDHTALTEIVIPDTVTEIGEYAFAHCENVSTVVIGSGVTRIKNCAFAAPNKTGLADFGGITYHGTIAQWNNIQKDSGWDAGSFWGNLTVHCDGGDTQINKNA